MSDDQARDVPVPGRRGAPETTSDPDADVDLNEQDDTVTRDEESGVGPGAGAAPIVCVTAPVQHEDDERTAHPTLRDQDRSEP